MRYFLTPIYNSQGDVEKSAYNVWVDNPNKSARRIGKWIGKVFYPDSNYGQGTPISLMRFLLETDSQV